MGNTNTTVSSECHNVEELSDQLSLGLDPTKGIAYDSSKSYAVCVGVGHQDRMDNGHLGEPADNDAFQVQRTLVEKYSFPEEQTILLNSNTKKPTRFNVKEALTSSARKVGRGGILLFHFSGHCMKLPYCDLAALIPADYDQSLRSVITSQNLTDCLRGTRASTALILLDCCHSGQIAKQLVYEWNLPNLPTHILVSCSSEQKSFSFLDLRNGIFTYFLVRFLRAYEDGGQEIPTGMAVEHCKPLCEALIKIMNPAHDGHIEMQPGIWVRDDKLQYRDEVDHSAKIFTEITSKYEFLNKYIEIYNSKSPLPVVPTSVSNWLNREAKESLHTLKVEMKDMSGVILMLLTQSVAKLLYEYVMEKDALSEIFQGSLFLSAAQSALQLIHSVEPTYSVGLSDLDECLLHYVIKLKDLTNVPLDDTCMDDLQELSTMIYDDIDTQQQAEAPPIEQSEMGASIPPKSPGARAEAGWDNVDGPSRKRTYARLNALMDVQRIPVIPGITVT